jgi:NADPH:quinone reductase
MPNGSKIIAYGNLSKDRVKDIDAFKLMYNDITIKGFMVNKWIREKYWFQKLWIIRKVRKLFRTSRQPNVVKEFELKDLQKAVEFYESNMTKGKVVIKPWSKIAPTVDLK